MIRRRFFPRIFIVACTLASLFYLAFVQEGGSSKSISYFSGEEGDGGELAESFAGRISPRKRTSKDAGAGWDRRGRNGDSHGQRPLQEADLTNLYRPPGSAYPYTWTLVLSTVTFTDITWLNTSLTALVPPHGNLHIANYVNNDPSAPLHAPIAKGNEVMGYLTYILDNYDAALPDISVFMHGSATAWHNNDLLDFASATLLARLNLDQVLREGYVNLRCQWKPGCPAHIRPHAEEFDVGKQEEALFLSVWPELFPGVTRANVPRILAQPCCAQFALSRAAIRRIPKRTYERLRDWIIETPLGSQYIGQIFEYVWQYLFLDGKEIHCPDPRVCYCATYGVCLADPEGYNEFFRLRRKASCCQKKLDGWEDAQVDDGDGSRKPEDPQSRDHRGWLQEQCTGIRRQSEEMMRAAWEVGMDPVRRAEVVRAARMDGDFVPDDESDCQDYEL